MLSSREAGNALLTAIGLEVPSEYVRISPYPAISNLSYWANGTAILLSAVVSTFYAFQQYTMKRQNGEWRWYFP